MNKKRLIILLLALVLIAAVAMGIYLFVRQYEQAESPAFNVSATNTEENVSETTQEDLESRIRQNDIILPIGKLLVTRLRAAYQDEELRLVIPRLDLDTTVWGDTTLETLAKGPGLYKYAQIPNTYNTNVSIAAHRDLHGFEFYYLDTVTENDRIYLVYKGKVFKYEYRSTRIIKDNDWSCIRTFHDSRVTLTTCDPIGTSLNRMVVVGELLEIDDYSEEYVFE